MKSVLLVFVVVAASSFASGSSMVRAELGFGIGFC